MAGDGGLPVGDCGHVVQLRSMWDGLCGHHAHAAGVRSVRRHLCDPASLVRDEHTGDAAPNRCVATVHRVLVRCQCVLGADSNICLTLWAGFTALTFLGAWSHLRAMTSDPGIVPDGAVPVGTREGTPDSYYRACGRCNGNFKPRRSHHCSVRTRPCALFAGLVCWPCLLALFAGAEPASGSWLGGS
jgi:hypothetical protein